MLIAREPASDTKDSSNVPSDNDVQYEGIHINGKAFGEVSSRKALSLATCKIDSLQHEHKQPGTTKLFQDLKTWSVHGIHDSRVFLCVKRWIAPVSLSCAIVDQVGA